MNEAVLPLSVNGQIVNLFNGDEMAALLRHVMPGLFDGSNPSEVRVERCWPIGAPDPSGLVFEWAFQVDGHRHTLYGEWGRRRTAGKRHRKSAVDAPERRHDPVLTSEGIRGVAVQVDDGPLFLRSPDQDVLLPQMSTCLDSRRMSERLRVFGLRTAQGRRRLRCRLGGYRPGRRATVRFKNAYSDVHLCGKTFRDARGKKLIQRHLRLSAELRRHCGHRVRVPSPVGYDDELNMALFVWMLGVRAERMVDGGDGLIQASVEALTAIHGLPPEERDPFTPDDEWFIVDRWRRCLALVAPGTASEADELAARLHRAREWDASVDPVTIHRDFYEKQIIVAPEGVTVLDLDTLARGNPCVDVGNFLAHLLLRHLTVHEAPPMVAGQARRFLEHYESRRGPLDQRSLAFYTASSLFRLGAVHALRTRTTDYRRALWEAARRVLEREEVDFSVCLERTSADSRMSREWTKTVDYARSLGPRRIAEGG